MNIEILWLLLTWCFCKLTNVLFFVAYKLLRDQMNEAAWEASKALLIPCQNCGRKFAPDRLPVHLKSCKETPGKNVTQPTNQAIKANEVSNPQMIIFLKEKICLS
jgi:hypothetical protein